MADTPSDGGSTDAPTPRRPRKPRTTSSRSSATRSVKARTPRAKSAAQSATEAVTKVTKPATKRKSSAAPKKPRTTTANVVKRVKTAAADTVPTSTGGKFAIAAAVAGVAAGVAALFGRKKLVKAANDAIGSVGGGKSQPEIPTRAD